MSWKKKQVTALTDRENKTITPGLPDKQFIRGEVPLTKEEIRCLTLSKLRLKEGQTVLDVGAGSGGLSIEIALLMPGGTVFAVERDLEATALIRANLKKFGAKNVVILETSASKALEGNDLPKTLDRVVVGGSGKELDLIIKRGFDLLVPEGIMVINCILLETLHDSLNLLEQTGFTDIGFIQASIARSREIGKKRALKPLNPVFIVSAKKSVQARGAGNRGGY